MTQRLVDDDTEARLRSAEERIFAAIAARDVAALDAELADDFVHTSIAGAAQDRASFLEAIRTMPYRILEIRGEGLAVRAFGETAALSGVQRARVELPDGSVVTASTAFVDLFVANDDRWRLRHAWSVELRAGWRGRPTPPA